MDKLEIKFVKGNKSLNIDSNSLFKIESIEGIDTNEIEINSISNATYDGMTILSKRATNKPISIRIDYLGKEKEKKRKEIINFFNTKSQGVLIVTYGDIKRAIEYHIENFSCPLKNIHYKLSFSVDLICPIPYFKEVIDRKVDVALWLGQFTFPLCIPSEKGIIMGYRQPSTIINIENNGDVETGMIIKIKALGNVTNPKIMNINNGNYMKINKTMIKGEEITINTNKGQKKIIDNLNGIGTNILNLLDINSKFLTLNIGDNLINYTAEENANNLEISIYYSPLYMGV